MTTHIYIRGEKGGSGSGNWGHAGRPGLVGGSGGGAGMAMGAGRGAGPKSPGQSSGGDDANSFLNDIVGDYGSSTGENWGAASDAERESNKRAIISELTILSGVDEDTVNEVIKQWAETSNDNDIKALSLQEAAAEELGLKLSAWQQERLDNVTEEGYNKRAATLRESHPDWEEERITHSMGQMGYSLTAQPITSRTNERAIIRAMYDNTQEQLAKVGYSPGDTISLFRGITYGDSNPGRAEGATVDYKGNSMESWSVSGTVAMNFATSQGNYDEYGEVASMAVPVSSIIGTARTGFGCLTEGEFIIAGNVPGSKATVWEAVKPYTPSIVEEAGFWSDIGEASGVAAEILAQNP